MHIALVGDSTLDNRAYTGGGPSVTDHLNDALSASARASLVAVDGARLRDLPYQIDTLPSDVTHIVLSVGGNDAAMEIGILGVPATTVMEALVAVDERVQRFTASYREGLAAVCDTGLPVTVCTIYNGDFNVATGEKQAIKAALKMWNDAIVQAAMDYGCPVIDLRRVCTEKEDFTRQIEPNEQGGRKIAHAIAASLTSSPSAVVSVGPLKKASTD